MEKSPLTVVIAARFGSADAGLATGALSQTIALSQPRPLRAIFQLLLSAPGQKP